MRRKIVDYFIPNADNDYKPHSLQRAAVLGMAVMVLLSFSLTNLQSLVWISSDWLVSTILPAVIVDLTNEERADEAVGTLRRNPLLDRSAQLKAEDMAAKGYFAHESPTGETPWFWFGEAGYNFVHAGENLAVHFTDSGEVVKAWMGSPTHRANIVNGNYQEIGIGTAKGVYEGFPTIFVVQHFGSPVATVPNSPLLLPEVAAAAPAVVVEEPLTTSEVLAESVDIVEIIAVEAPPEPPVQALVTTAEPDVPVSESEPVTTLVTTSTEAHADEAPVMTFVSTSTGGVPASLEPATPPTPAQSTWWGALLTRPQLVLEFLYVLSGGFVLVSLLLAIVIEIRRQEPVQIAYALVLLGLMYGLYELHVALTSGALIA